MQWGMLYLWASLAVYGGRRESRRAVTRALLTAALLLSMTSQLWLLWLDGNLRLETGLPLHLCGMMGVLSVPLLWLTPPRLYHFSLLLGAPCAFVTLFFPAVIASSRPFWMSLAFCRLHAVIVCAALFCRECKTPPPPSARPSFLWANGYLLAVAVFNRIAGTNYLFLRAIPPHTPLSPLFARGTAFYVCALEILCMLVMGAIAESTSACSPCSRCTSPCTTARRGLEWSRSAR